MGRCCGDVWCKAWDQGALDAAPFAGDERKDVMGTPRIVMSTKKSCVWFTIRAQVYNYRP